MKYARKSHTGPSTGAASNFLFWLYIYYIVDFFLHLSARIPGYGVIRPTLLLVVVITLLLIAQRKKFAGFGNSHTFVAMKWLLLFIAITTPLTTWPGSVIRENIPLFVKAISFFFFTALIIDSEKRLRVFLAVFVGCQVFRVLEPLFLHVTTGYWGDKAWIAAGEFAGRLAGAPADVVNPNGLGFVIVTVIPYLHYLMGGSESKLYRVLYIGVLPLLIYALVLTMSRGAFLALFVVLWMIFRNSTHKVALVMVVLAAAPVLWSNLSPLQKERYLSLVGAGSGAYEATAEGRFTGMKNEFLVGLQRPIVGHGLGTSKEAKYHSGYRRQAAHNLYAEVLVEIGALGLIFFLRYLYFLYQSFQRNRERLGAIAVELENRFEYRLNNALVTVFWMYAVFSINYYGLSQYYWYLFGGLTVAFSRIYFDDSPVSLARKGQTHFRPAHNTR